MGKQASQRTYSQRQLRVGEMVKQNLGELFIRDEAKITKAKEERATRKANAQSQGRGGGAGRGDGANGAAGGSGIVIVRYKYK